MTNITNQGNKNQNHTTSPTPVRRAIIKKARGNKFLRMRRKGDPGTLLLGMQIGATTLLKSMEVSQKPKNKTKKKLKAELQYNLAIPLLSIYLMKRKTLTQKDICTHKLGSMQRFFTKTKIWKQLKCPPMNEWINVVYVCAMEYYSAV